MSTSQTTSAPAHSARNAAPVLVDLPVDLVDVAANVRVDPGELADLAASILEVGVLQPVRAVGPHADGRYRLIYGQRRLLASRQAGLATIPAILDASSDADEPGAQRSIEQLVENLQRADLNPIDEARALRAVLDADRKLTQAALAQRLGRSQSWLANALRLLVLDLSVQTRISDGSLSASHGKAIASLPAKQQKAIAERVVSSKLSSKDLERELEWKRQEAANDEARAKRTDKWIPKAVAALRAAEYDALVNIAVSGGEWNIDLDALVRGLAAAGYPNATRRGYSFGSRPEGCTCTAIRLDVGGRKVVIEGTCVDDAHRDRALNGQRQADADRQVALLGRAKEAIREAIVDARLHPALLRLLARDHAGYSARPWADYLAMDERAAIDLITENVAAERALLWPDHAAIPIDTLIQHLAVRPEHAAPESGAVEATRAITDETTEADRGIDAPICSCGKPKVDAGHGRWACTNPGHPIPRTRRQPAPEAVQL